MCCYQQSFFTPTKEVNKQQFWALVGAPLTKELIDGVRAAKARGDELPQLAPQWVLDMMK